MNENKIINILKNNGVRMIASLPCDKNKGFTEAIHSEFDVVDLTREEDGVGICAGAFMAGVRSAISIQSSGLGNMMNALMSLTATYHLPLPIIASWRGVENEAIEAQIPFNSRIPMMMSSFDIDCYEISTTDDLNLIDCAIKKAFDEKKITVVLIKPSIWGISPAPNTDFPERSELMSILYERKWKSPKMKRIDAIKSLMGCITDNDVVISNIGVPSKEVFATRDRNLNFYMLGSYTQASAIGLGISLYSKRNIIVIDGDGSLLGSSILSVIASKNPKNLSIVCLDNGTFGSTGNQMNQSYSISDLELIAKGSGIMNTVTTTDGEQLPILLSSGEGPRFIRMVIMPGNSKSPNLTLSADQIRDRFIGSI